MKSCDIDQLVEQYSDSVYRYCKSIAYTPEDAEDLYQQTFLKAFELHKRISLEKNPKAYLLWFDDQGIAKHSALMAGKMGKHEIRCLLDDVEEFNG